MIKGENYKERINYQLSEWVKGNSIHNDVDDECCPDFSCCTPLLLQPKKIRETYRKVYYKMKNEPEDPEFHPYYDQYIGMLYSFLEAGISNWLPEEKVFIVDGNTEIKLELN
jgi:hypothetical protein